MKKEEEKKKEAKEKIETELKKDQEIKEKGSTELIDKANLAASRLEAANVKREELLEKEEALKVETTLGGKAEGDGEGNKEETPEEYAKKVLENDVEGTQDS